VGTWAQPGNGGHGYAAPLPRGGLPIDHRLGTSGGPASAWARL